MAQRGSLQPARWYWCQVVPQARSEDMTAVSAVDSGHQTGGVCRLLPHERGPQAHAPSASLLVRPRLHPGRRRVRQRNGWLDVRTRAIANAGAVGLRGSSAGLCRPVGLGLGVGGTVRFGGCLGRPSGSAAAGGATVTIVASGIAFTTATVTAPAGTPFTLEFDNEDAGHPARRPDQGRHGRRGVHDRHLPGRREARLPGARPGRRHLPVHLHRPPEHDRHPHGPVGRGDDDPGRRAALLLGRLRCARSRPGSSRSSRATPTWSPSIGRSSTQAAAASRRTGAAAASRPTVAPGPCAAPASRWRDRPRAGAGRRGPAGRRRPAPGGPRVGPPAGPHADPHRAPRAVRRRLARLRRAGHRRQHGARIGPDGLRVRADERRPRRRHRGDRQRRAGRRARRPGQRPAARRGVRDPRSHPHEDQPAAPGIDEIRTIEIVGLDLQADGGTHVANTREVGGIRVTGYESKGRINKRIRIELVEPISDL